MEGYRSMRRERKFSRKRGTITSKKEKVNSEFLGTATNCSALVIIDEHVKSEDNSRLIFHRESPSTRSRFFTDRVLREI